MKKIFFELICLVFVFRPALSQHKLDSSVKVDAQISYESGNKDLISFSPKRPLTLNDFSAAVDKSSKGDAETYSGIFIKYYYAHTQNQLMVTVSVLPYFDKGESWCREESRNDKTLSHEQIHFDITAIKACEMIRKIKSFSFTLANYSKELEKISNTQNQEAQELQEKYDLETSHGRNGPAQEAWKEMIYQSLANQLCYQ